jgi:hypothetical protein
MVLSLLAALAFGCADASDEEATDESSDDSATVDVTDPAPDPCVYGELDGTEGSDGVSTVSGYDMSTPEAALAAYTRLREACGLKATVNRRGKPLTIEYPIK